MDEPGDSVVFCLEAIEFRASILDLNMVNMPFYYPDMDLILKWVNTVLRTILTLFWPGSIYFGPISAGNPVTL